MTYDVRQFDSFGKVSAEDDEVLQYFLTTDIVQELQDNTKFLVLGRKGAGKTAIVRHFAEGPLSNSSVALSLRSYPWNVHAKRVDASTDPVDTYVMSWRYLIVVAVATWVVENAPNVHSDELETLKRFLSTNYGGLNRLCCAKARIPLVG